MQRVRFDLPYANAPLCGAHSHKKNQVMPKASCCDALSPNQSCCNYQMVMHNVAHLAVKRSAVHLTEKFNTSHLEAQTEAKAFSIATSPPMPPYAARILMQRTSISSSWPKLLPISTCAMLGKRWHVPCWASLDNNANNGNHTFQHMCCKNRMMMTCDWWAKQSYLDQSWQGFL